MALPDLGNIPPGKLLVLLGLKSKMLSLAHSSHLACYPGLSCTFALLRRRFWWPAMEEDTKGFVVTCPTCAENKISSQPSSGLLLPLPILEHPWSNLAMDFIIGLLSSNGHTVILTIVERFSKWAHFLQKRPSTRETADILIREVFFRHGLPQDIVSD